MDRKPPRRAKLAIPSRLKLFYFLHLSKPTTDRAVYRAIHCQQARKIVELGIGSGQRAKRMIEVASLAAPPREVLFTGMDLFEDRPAADSPGLSLRAAYQMLRSTGARVKLVPGDPLEGLMRTANDLGQIDLLILSPGLDPQQLARAWFFVPRLLHERSQVWTEQFLSDGQTRLTRVAGAEIRTLAAAAMRRRAA
jgi:hypothetical protein